MANHAITYKVNQNYLQLSYLHNNYEHPIHVSTLVHQRRAQITIQGKKKNKKKKKNF